MKIHGAPPTAEEWRAFTRPPFNATLPADPLGWLESCIDAVVDDAKKRIVDYQWGARWPGEPVRARQDLFPGAAVFELMEERGRPRRVRSVGHVAEFTFSDIRGPSAAWPEATQIELGDVACALALGRLDPRRLRNAADSMMHALDELVHDDPGKSRIPAIDGSLMWSDQPVAVPVSAVEILPPEWVRDTEGRPQIRFVVLGCIAPHPDHPSPLLRAL